MQTYLNGLRDAKYPTLNRLVVDGRYGSATASTVMQYQVINRLFDGRRHRPRYLERHRQRLQCHHRRQRRHLSRHSLRPGDRSQDVRHMQGRLNEVARIYTGINTQTVDGAYGNNMTNAVRRFQRQFSLSADGILGKDTGTRSSPCITPCRRATPRTLPLSIPAYCCA